MTESVFAPNSLYEPRRSHQEAKDETYSFKVVLELDGEAWCAYCPALEQIGGATWGTTREELFNFRFNPGRLLATLTSWVASMV